MPDEHCLNVGTMITVATAVPSSGKTRVRHKEQKVLGSIVPRDKVTSSGPAFRVYASAR